MPFSIAMRWGKKRIAGVDYDLTHLNDFDVLITPPHEGAPTYRVQVGFGAHTFTRKLDPNDTPDYHFRDGSNTRCFCPKRHSCSLHLPGIIRKAMEGDAYFGNKEPLAKLQ
jgi:hypothetical protein